MITMPRPTRQVVPQPTREVVRRHLAADGESPPSLTSSNSAQSVRFIALTLSLVLK
jgi:hypothetical protein